MPLTSGVSDPELLDRSLIPGVGTPEIWVTFDTWLKESTLNNEEWLNGILKTIEADIVRVLGYLTSRPTSESSSKELNLTSKLNQT